MPLITSITGLQNLTNLDYLDLDSSDNHIQTIDLSGMSSLTYVDISDNDLPDSSTPSLTSINLSGCTSLESLYLDDSDFSGGFPDLSDCTALRYIDFDQCDIIGSVDISNLPVLERFDFSGNDQLTELIISRDQPLGFDGNELLADDCALTQTAIDNILVELSLSDVTNGYIDLRGEGNSYPGNTGLDALDVLDEKGWSWDVNSAPTPPGAHTQIAASTDFNISGDFTIETFFRIYDPGVFSRLYSFGTFPAANAISLENGNVFFWGNNDQILSAGFAPIYNQWYHLCVQRTDGLITIFADGVSLNTTSYSDDIPSQGLPLTIGYGNESDTDFNGYLSNFRWSNEAVYNTEGFTPPTSPLSDLESTKLLIFQGTDLTAQLTDNSGNGNNATNLDAQYNELNPFVGATGSLVMGQF